MQNYSTRYKLYVNLGKYPAVRVCEVNNHNNCLSVKCLCVGCKMSTCNTSLCSYILLVLWYYGFVVVYI